MAIMKKDIRDIQKDIKALDRKMEKLLKALDKEKPAKTKRPTKKAATRAVKPKRAPAKKAVAGKKRLKVTATEQVLKVIKRSIKGVDVPTLKKKTGFEDKKIRNIIFRTSKEGKIKKVGRGVYVGA